MRTAASFALLLMVLLEASATGQQSLARRFPAGNARMTLSPPDSRLFVSVQQEPASVPSLAVAGLLGAATGFFGGAMIGSSAENRYFPCGCDDPGLMGALLGAMIAPAVTTPLAVHLANRRRGSFPRGLGLGAIVAGAGILGTLVNIRDETAALFLVLTPLAQVAVAVHNERSTTN